ncbi:MAG: dethiobiotin synthase [Bacteroidales bacterium]|jgi:dethiobiotin synthetase|nr:dethiobiotin synthase [Bacteroidales bacterium]
MNKTYFISGIDTDCGKTIVTGLISKYLLSINKNVITQKLVQTGTEGIADDIITHRRIMNKTLFAEDKNKKTCPFVFQLPASPHLSAKLENTKIDCSIIDKNTNTLNKNYDIVLLEGAGGLHVPINNNENIIDFIEERNYPLILVTSAKLGSINHTLMSLEICYNRKIKLAGLIYNNHPANNSFIQEDTIEVFRKYLKTHFPKSPLIEIPLFRDTNYPEINFSELLRN